MLREHAGREPAIVKEASETSRGRKQSLGKESWLETRINTESLMWPQIHDALDTAWRPQPCTAPASRPTACL